VRQVAETDARYVRISRFRERRFASIPGIPLEYQFRKLLEYERVSLNRFDFPTDPVDLCDDLLKVMLA
jgi:hypothetical protein